MCQSINQHGYTTETNVARRVQTVERTKLTTNLYKDIHYLLGCEVESTIEMNYNLNMNNLENMQYPAPKQDYKVLVRCYTYNHSKYIEDALNGFAMQQTSFPFVCLVVDDASTDGEQDIIKAWMERECNMNMAEIIDIPTSIVIIVPHKTKVSCTFAFYLLKQNLYKVKGEKKRHVDPWRNRCEYEAICEGDDYWVDPLKLQKQVGYLDSNPCCVLSHTGFEYIEDDFDSINRGKYLIKQNLSILNSNENLLVSILDGNRYLIQTMTVVFRLEIYNKVKIELESYSHLFKMGDTPLWVTMLSYGRIHFLPEVTSCYRLHIQSASHQSDMKSSFRFNLSCAEMRVYLGQKYNIPEPIQKKFQKEYQNHLSRYLCLDEYYKPFIELQFDSKLDKLIYIINNNKILRRLRLLMYSFRHKML